MWGCTCGVRVKTLRTYAGPKIMTGGESVVGALVPARSGFDGLSPNGLNACRRNPPFALRPSK